MIASGLALKGDLCVRRTKSGRGRSELLKAVSIAAFSGLPTPNTLAGTSYE